MNNNKQDASALEAHCHGVFQKTGYITIGTPDAPLGLIPKEPLPARWKGRQLAVPCTKTGRTLDTFFERTFKSLGEGDKYVDKWRYLESGQEKKKGFGTSDFSKRDEFSNTTRTLQWREQLAHEAKWTDAAVTFFSEAAAGSASSEQQQQQSCQDRCAAGGQLLFDLVFEKTRDHRLPASSRLHRDTQNATMHSRERCAGGQLTTHALTYAPPAPGDLAKPEFARKPLIRDSFYRRTNVVFPPGCDATTAA